MANLTPLFTATQIQERVAAMGATIRAEHGDDPLTCICVLKGSFLFMADLVRAIGGDVRCEFLAAASYHGGTRSTGVVRIEHDLRHPIEGHRCLLVEDIVDTGLTLDHLLRTLRLRGPSSLRVASLLDKAENREVEVPIDYVGFTIPNHFVVGYGLDLGERFRNLPEIAIYHP